MAPLPPETPDRASPRIVILGNDVLLAAAPATAVQLAHACMAIGYDLVVPESWGDELIATETLRQLERRTGEPAILCSCPYVGSRLLAAGGDLAPFLISLVAPPVAVARYLRSMFAEHTLRLTYVGACPAGADPSIDAHIEPDAFLTRIADHGIALEQQPTVFDSVVPPDRRRWSSLPGGTPSSAAIERTEPGRSLFEVQSEDISTEIAQLLIAQDVALVDLSTRLGCACAARRDAIAALEPPRSTGPVVEPLVQIALSRPLSSPVREEAEASDASVLDDAGAFELSYADEDDAAPSSPALLPAGDDEHPTAEPAMRDDEHVAEEREEPEEQEPSEPRSSDVRRRRPATVRPAGGASPPRARNGERTLPRAYVAKRRASGSASTPTPTEHAALEWDDAKDEALGARPSALGGVAGDAEARAMDASEPETRELETRELEAREPESHEPESRAPERREPGARAPRDPLPPPRARSATAPGSLAGETSVGVATPPHALPPIEVEPRAATPLVNAPIRPTPRETSASHPREASTLEQRLRHPLALVLMAIIIALVVFLIVGS